MGYEIINPVALRQIGTICMSKKDRDYRPIYQLDESDIALGGDLRIGSARNYRQPQFIKDPETGKCIYNPLFHTFLVKKVGKCSLILMNDDETWDEVNKVYFHEIYYEHKF